MKTKQHDVNCFLMNGRGSWCTCQELRTPAHAPTWKDCQECFHNPEHMEKHAPAHTPTPLKVDLPTYLTDNDGFSFDAIEITADDGAATIAYATTQERAAFIVQAVNAHEELVQALKDAKSQLQKVCSWHDLTEEQSAGFNGIEDILADAIAKAEGKQS